MTNLVVPQLKLLAVIEGTPDPQTGYLCNVAELDGILREIVTEHLIPVYGDAGGNTGHPISAPFLLIEVYQQFQQRWRSPQRMTALVLRISDQLSWTLNPKSAPMLQLTQQFEFSAAHRLHCDSMTIQENKDTFGKCNNPNGHGHNYVFDVTVEQTGDAGMDLEQLQRLVKAAVIDRLDHKHLNEDVPYFAKVNPSVENIAVLVFDWIKVAFTESGLGGDLVAVKVFETPKTWAEYREPNNAR